MARAQDPPPGGPPPLPRGPIRHLTRPFERFLHVEAASGVVLLAAATVALIAANSGVAEGYAAFWETHLVVGAGGFVLDYPLWYWVNDALMAIFFFVIGLEIKREIVLGELRDPRSLALPLAGAIGGAVLPAAIFLGLRAGAPGAEGWAIPMATDIAFVVGAMALLGPRIPSGLKVLMLSLAIVDDLIAVVIIALFFTAKIKLGWLLGAGIGLALCMVLNRLGVRRVGVYLLVGVGVWLCTLKSGIHPTVAGVLLGLLTPASAWVGTATLWEVLRAALSRYPTAPEPQGDYLSRVELERVAEAAHEAISPLERLEVGLHPWVGFVIMPIFALANAAVPLSSDSLADPVGLAVAAGLVIGKPVGIVLAILLVVRLGLGSLPTGVTWPMMAGAGALAGIGFTMALFIASLALDPELLDPARAGILLGSLLSGVIGMAVLAATTRKT